MNSTKENELIKKALGRTPTGRERQDITTSVASNGDFIVADRGTVIGKLKAGTFENNSFQNGVAKAEQEIMNKASQVGVKFENAMSFTLKTGQAVSDMASNELGKLLTYKEGELLAARVREGAWSDEDVKKHILRSNYKKWEEPKFRSSSFGLMEQQRMRSMLK